MVKISRFYIIFLVSIFISSPLITSEKKKVEVYFNNMKTLKSDFTQISMDGSVSYGKIFMKRPNKFKIIFNPPQNELIISDGRKIALINKKIKTISLYGMDQIPFSFLLSKTFDYDNFKMSKIMSKNNILSFKISEPDSKKKIRLIFENRPFGLKKWEVTDEQGNLTQVSLNNLSINENIEKNTFVITDPRKIPFGRKE